MENYPIKDNTHKHRPLNNTKPYTHPNYKNTKQQTQTPENLQKTEQFFERFRRRTGLVNLPKPDCNMLFIEVTRTLV
jgi:hypothetical protein